MAEVLIIELLSSTGFLVLLQSYGAKLYFLDTLDLSFLVCNNEQP
jgi:hypothetical protein